MKKFAFLLVGLAVFGCSDPKYKKELKKQCEMRVVKELNGCKPSEFFSCERIVEKAYFYRAPRDFDPEARKYLIKACYKICNSPNLLEGYQIEVSSKCMDEDIFSDRMHRLIKAWSKMN